MRFNIAISSIVLGALSFVSKTWAAPDPNFHIYLAFGQSNMQGAGTIENQDKTVDKRFKMLATAQCNGRSVGNWYDATPPLAHCGGGLGPVDYFGRTLVKKLPQEIKVGVAVVAVAGCDIQLFEKENYKNYKNMPDWMKGMVNSYGGNPYGRLVEMGKKAKQDGVIKGILLHQGETNTGQQNWPNRVKAIYDDLIKDLGLNASEVPLLIGEVVSRGAGGSCASHNDIIKKVPQIMSNAYVVSSDGLAQQGDGLHFTSAAYRTFGERFANTMLKILGDVKVDDGGNTGGNTGGNEEKVTPVTSDKITDGLYYIKNTKSNRYLSIKDGVEKAVQNVVISSNKQKWKIVNNKEDGTVLILTESGEFALDIANGASTNGANIQIYTTHGGDAQRFIIRQTSNSGVYVIDTKVTNGTRALDIEGNKTNEGTNVCQWDDQEKANQVWEFELISKSDDGKQDDGKQEDASCWSTSLGYPCCKTCLDVAYEDESGKWGVENDDWCGLAKTCSSGEETPSQCKGANGYPCCKFNCDVYDEDEDGKWSLENNDWCLIDEAKC